jgi:dTDP-4-dehydrorhamnose reductase
MTGRPTNAPPIEVWGSLACSLTRVGDEYFDQLACSGHDRREADLDLFAGLGLRTLLYPVLWERTAPRSLRSADWSWPDRRIERLRELEIAPIINLLHHGSGPLYTNLIDPCLPSRLAAYAGAVAERYPWVEAYAPVYEPLATALASGLSGQWYPHRQDDHAFARALVLQCRAIAAAMNAIRRVTPNARLVLPEHVGYTRSTPSLAYYADFENERRWLGFDLLTGRVVPGHPLFSYLVRAHVSTAELARLADRPCPPDVVGINYHVTSERFLDDRLSLYPHEWQAGHHLRRYVDVEAVHLCTAGLRGPAYVLGEAFRRYGTPLALTEAHLEGTPDERMRWLVHAWREARYARDAGVDVRAVTASALLGQHDPTLPVVEQQRRYEPGVFSLADGEPRPSIVTEAVRALNAGHEPEHRVLGRPGWWQRPERIRYKSDSPVKAPPAPRDSRPPALEAHPPN